jgi:hypothetical protein
MREKLNIFIYSIIGLSIINLTFLWYRTIDYRTIDYGTITLENYQTIDCRTKESNYRTIDYQKQKKTIDAQLRNIAD